MQEEAKFSFLPLSIPVTFSYQDLNRYTYGIYHSVLEYTIRIIYEVDESFHINLIMKQTDFMI